MVIYKAMPRLTRNGRSIQDGRPAQIDSSIPHSTICITKDTADDFDQMENAESRPEALQLVKVLLLGAPAVGKTSIIQQFVWNSFPSEYRPTERKHTFYPSVMVNEHVYELKVSDVPVVPYFPPDSDLEWAEFRHYGLRSASAYVLVFDLADADSFQYVRTLRQQMMESRDLNGVPLLVLGNKQELNASHGTMHVIASYHTNIQWQIVKGNTMDLAPHSEQRRHIASLVRKHWKCAYAECSAKYNWRVLAAFRDLMQMVHTLRAAELPASPVTGGHSHRNADDRAVHRCHVS